MQVQGTTNWMYFRVASGFSTQWNRTHSLTSNWSHCWKSRLVPGVTLTNFPIWSPVILHGTKFPCLVSCYRPCHEEQEGASNLWSGIFWCVHWNVQPSCEELQQLVWRPHSQGHYGSVFHTVCIVSLTGHQHYCAFVQVDVGWWNDIPLPSPATVPADLQALWKLQPRQWSVIWAHNKVSFSEVKIVWQKNYSQELSMCHTVSSLSLSEHSPGKCNNMLLSTLVSLGQDSTNNSVTRISVKDKWLHVVRKSKNRCWQKYSRRQ